MDDNLKRRFLALPKVEQRRLVHLVEWMQKGRDVSSLLPGFPKESLAIMEGMLNQRMEEDQREE